MHDEPAARLDPQVVDEMANSPVVEGDTPVSEPVFSLLASVNVLAALVPPTAVLAKVALAGVNVACALPVPVNDTLCGLPPALSVKLIAPVRVPTCVGVKVTLILQFFPAASVLPQALELMAKSPLGVMLVMFNVPVPVLDSVIVLAAVVAPTTVLANVSDVGESVTTG